MTEANRISDIPKTKHFGVLEHWQYEDQGGYDVSGFNYYHFATEAELLAWVERANASYSTKSYTIIEAIPRTVQVSLVLVKEPVTRG